MKSNYVHRHSEEYNKGYLAGKEQGKLDTTKQILSVLDDIELHHASDREKIEFLMSELEQDAKRLKSQIKEGEKR